MAGRFKRNPFTDKERKHRIDQNLYLYYSSQNHKAYKYLKKPKTRVASVVILPFTSKSNSVTDTLI